MTLEIVAAVGRELEQAMARDQQRSRARRLGPRAIAVAVVGVLALAAAVGAATGLLRVGSVIPAGPDALPREGDHVVVATGTARVGGPWRMEAYTSGRLTDPKKGTLYQPNGLPCIDLMLLDPLAGQPTRGGGQCGSFRGAPGFGYSALLVTDSKGRHEQLVFGRAPRRAVIVRLAVPRGGNRRSVRTRQGPSGTDSDYWLMSVPAVHPDARLRWFDRHGHTAGRRLVLPASHSWEHAPRRARP
jgi:hypothetical protein